MVGPLRLNKLIKQAATAAAMLVVLSTASRAQYNFVYSVFGSYTNGGDGSPFSKLLCTGLTPNINYDNNPDTHNPKIPVALCPAVGPAGINFGAQFFAYMFTWTAGYFSFYVGTDDGSSLFIDGVDVLDMPGSHSYTSQTVTIYLAAMAHTYLLDYYADNVDDFHGKAVQATVDPKLNVTPYKEPVLPPEVFPSPEPSALMLALTGFGMFAAGMVLRRRRMATTA